jgi:hypothetical protein
MRRKIMSVISETNCFYHPDRAAEDTCTECGQPICPECQTLIAGKTVCRQCVSAIRERVAREMSTGSVAAQTAPMQQMTAPSAQSTDPSESGVYQPYVPPVPTHTRAMGIGHVFGGFGLGFLAGVVGLVAWLAIVSVLPFNSALFAVGLGWLIGVAATKGAGGRGGNVVAMMSALLALIFCGIGVLLFSSGGEAWGWIFGLLCLFFGVQQAYKTPMTVENHW